jgi:hypothetical protein
MRTPTPTNTPVDPAPTPTLSTGTNLALNQPTTVSSQDSVNQSGAKAVDGSASTYWRTLKASTLMAERRMALVEKDRLEKEIAPDPLECKDR